MDEIAETATMQPADLAERSRTAGGDKSAGCAVAATLLGEAEAACGEPADAGRAFGAGGA